ncbi:hypothetical protein AAFF_G00268330 [Aldrovandia affinis]|uniref:Uncharacterized protein n=1 Tax=Aldrovandia affinis TaxID=143900 RepID=A0AAD7WTK4_9TELE|nr:hypothetical protein AAFF_G00268330 [Aldrovandia affinis]
MLESGARAQIAQRESGNGPEPGIVRSCDQPEHGRHNKDGVTPGDREQCSASWGLVPRSRCHHQQAQRIHGTTPSCLSRGRGDDRFNSSDFLAPTPQKNSENGDLWILNLF